MIPNNLKSVMYSTMLTIIAVVIFISCAKKETPDNTPDEYFYYKINDSSYSFTSPTDTIKYTIFENISFIPFAGVRAVNPGNQFAGLTFSEFPLIPNSTHTYSNFGCTQITGPTIPINPPINVFITEFGNIGEHVSGNFSGTIRKTLLPLDTFIISGRFRAIREN